MRIAIGGMISSGKTTLINRLAAELPNYRTISELREDDELFNTLLLETYAGNEDARLLLQIHFIRKHWTLQNKYKGSENILIDRHIMEHWLFAHNRLFGKDWEIYNNIFHSFMEDIPDVDLYIILDVSFEEFERRIRLRNRAVEMENFEENKEYFQDLLAMYTEKLKAQCVIYEIPYVIIKTDGISAEQVYEEVSNFLELDVDY